MERIERKHRALMQLAEWRKIHEQRDLIITDAMEAGISMADVSAIVGLSRSQVARIYKNRHRSNVAITAENGA